MIMRFALILQAGDFLPTHKFLLKDKAGEKKWGFQLRTSVERAAACGVLGPTSVGAEPKRFLVHKQPENAMPIDDLKRVIVAAGGEVVPSASGIIPYACIGQPTVDNLQGQVAQIPCYKSEAIIMGPSSSV